MNPKQPTHKNIFFSYEGLRKYFLPTHFVNPVQDYYICKPIAGLLTTSVNFFQDESFDRWTLVRADEYIFGFLLLTSTLYFQLGGGSGLDVMKYPTWSNTCSLPAN